MKPFPCVHIVNKSPPAGRGRPSIDAFTVRRLETKDPVVYQRSDCEGFHVKPSGPGNG